MNKNDYLLDYPEANIPGVSVEINSAWDGSTLIYVYGLKVAGFECYAEICGLSGEVDDFGGNLSGSVSLDGHVFFEDELEAEKVIGDRSLDFDSDECRDALGADLYNTIAQYALTCFAIDLYNNSFTQKEG